MTVPKLPPNEWVVLGKQIGRMFVVYCTGLSKVSSATSLYKVRESNERCLTIRFTFFTTCCVSKFVRILWSPRFTVIRATSAELMLWKIIISISDKIWFLPLESYQRCYQVNTYWATQCAAVKMCRLSIKDPPQNCLPLLKSATAHGHSFKPASCPPTIRSWSWFPFFDPQ